MATEKLFSVVGTAIVKGETKVRFANDLVSRIKNLTKAGCTAINLIELPKPMTKLGALQFLQKTTTLDPDQAFAVEYKVTEKTKLAKKGEVAVSAKGVKVSKSKVVEPVTA